MSDPPERPDVPVADHLLGELYRDFAPISLTLLVGGRWITGTAVNGRAWFNELGILIAESSADNEASGAWFQRLGQLMYPSESEIDAGVADASLKNRPIGFIHLRNARAVDHAGDTPAVGTVLRVRLDSIEAWTIGELAPPGYTAPPPPL